MIEWLFIDGLYYAFFPYSLPRQENKNDEKKTEEARSEGPPLETSPSILGATPK